MLILLGSKNIIEDLLYIYAQGYNREIATLVLAGTPIIGICGGYQMLGKEIHDPEHTESKVDIIQGLGLLAAITEFKAEKLTHQVTARTYSGGFFGLAL